MRTRDMTDEQAEAHSLRLGIESRMRLLRNVLDRIEREALVNLEQAANGQGRYSSVAEVFVKELPQGIVNAGIEQLVYWSATADEYRVEANARRKMEEGK